jgi:inorganic phosphate transporter, PiT family
MSTKSAKSAKSAANIDFFTSTDTKLPIAIAVGFLLLIALVIHLLYGKAEYSLILVVSAVFGGYMALNIGANDVANNVAPAVGSKALTVAGALIIAGIFEAAGAFIAGGSVVKTISKGIIDPSMLLNEQVFIYLMLSALLAGAIWINLATYFGAPVSTTHSIVGAVMGAGIAAAGMGVVNWPMMGTIAASWVISPALGGAIAAVVYWAILRLVIDQPDRMAAARRWVPVFIGIMTAAFAMYLAMKGLKNVIAIEPLHVALLGVAVLILSPMVIRPAIIRQSKKLSNSKRDINKLFTYPLIASAALLSFAHGANDVANAVGPLAAIVGMLEHSGEGIGAAKIGIPHWVMVVGALGISLGLLLFGGKIVNTVGQSITKLTQVRAYCVALSAAVTVIIATGFGLPVSSTHIAVGSIFGVGLFREWRDLHIRRKRRKASKKEYEHQMIKRKLVRRRHLLSIMAAWVITVPCSSLLSALIYVGLYYFFV